MYIWEQVIHMHMCVHGHGRGWLVSASHCACSSILSCGELVVNGAEGLLSNMEPQHSMMHVIYRHTCKCVQLADFDAIICARHFTMHSA